jgi:seryl-tRNA synthetase
MCCILENNQTDTGVKIPQVLVPFMPDGIDFIPFVE